MESSARRIATVSFVVFFTSHTAMAPQKTLRTVCWWHIARVACAKKKDTHRQERQQQDHHITSTRRLLVLITASGFCLYSHKNYRCFFFFTEDPFNYIKTSATACFLPGVVTGQSSRSILEKLDCSDLLLSLPPEAEVSPPILSL
jgi:hypothetical protein